ncbi:acyltransferase [Ochrobactrum sp. SFR4]|uniref:acyltransferase family protein n=1 Tax=Ochrobactrum sp. SFR4 TaxID=2717368 RepID=UPI001C8BDD0A|nr:acyltransferase [Ochrobactrum sp. SFR4]MBX8824761.1 acyltransferase [Ochrobactrum sp. SFR4]
MADNRLISLQIARGIAALLVFVMHLFNMAGAVTGSKWAANVAEFTHLFGHIGVDVFFVLSGVVICVVVSRIETDTTNANTAFNATDFLVRRMVRVYPLFWMTLVACLILPATPGSDNSVTTLLNNPSSIFLLSKPEAHPVAWTLVYEIQFYIVATILLLFGRHKRKAFIAWALLQVFFVAGAKAALLPQWQIFDPLSLEFSMGILIGMFVSLRTLKRPMAWICAAAVAALCSSLYFGGNAIAFDATLRVIFWGIPSAIFIAAMISYEATHTLKKTAFSRMGDISYSIYMWHPIALLLSLMILGSWNTGGNTFVTIVYIVLSVFLTFSISKVSYEYVEKPLSRLFYIRPRQIKSA